jgi:hypothetical protein
MSEVSFPHPVLGNGDDVAIGSLDCDLTWQASAEVVELIFAGLTTGNPTLDDAVREGRATWLLRVQCARTYFRRIWAEPGPIASIRIPGPDLEGRVEVEARVCSTRPLDWQPAGAHEDYGNLSFHLGDAEVLALGPSWRFHVDKEFDPLKAPVSSWMRIVQGDHDDGPFQVEFGDEIVTIRLSRKDWDQYPGVRDRASSVLHTGIVLPVLMQALLELKTDDGVRWKSRLQAVLDDRGLSSEQPLQTAQELLAAPLARCLRDLNVKLDGGEE